MNNDLLLRDNEGDKRGWNDATRFHDARRRRRVGHAGSNFRAGREEDRGACNAGCRIDSLRRFDFKTLKRTPKLSASWFREAARRNRVVS